MSYVILATDLLHKERASRMERRIPCLPIFSSIAFTWTRMRRKFFYFNAFLFQNSSIFQKQIIECFVEECSFVFLKSIHEGIQNRIIGSMNIAGKLFIGIMELDRMMFAFPGITFFWAIIFSNSFQKWIVCHPFTTWRNESFFCHHSSSSLISTFSNTS